MVLIFNYKARVVFFVYKYGLCVHYYFWVPVERNRPGSEASNEYGTFSLAAKKALLWQLLEEIKLLKELLRIEMKIQIKSWSNSKNCQWQVQHLLGTTITMITRFMTTMITNINSYKKIIVSMFSKENCLPFKGFKTKRTQFSMYFLNFCGYFARNYVLKAISIWSLEAVLKHLFFY